MEIRAVDTFAPLALPTEPAVEPVRGDPHDPTEIERSAAARDAEDSARRMVRGIRRAVHLAAKPFLRGRNGLDHESRAALREAEHDLRDALKQAGKDYRRGDLDAAGFLETALASIEDFATSFARVAASPPSAPAAPAPEDPAEPEMVAGPGLEPAPPVVESVEEETIEIDEDDHYGRSRRGDASRMEFARSRMEDLIGALTDTLRAALDRLRETSQPPAPTAEPPLRDRPTVDPVLPAALDLRA